MAENLEELHAEATAPLSDDQHARSLSASSSDAQLAEATRNVIVKTLEIHGITHNTLNVSKSKFDKMNKAELIKALRNKENTAPKSAEAPKSDAPQLDYIGTVIKIKQTVEKARKSNDYTQLDGVIADTILTVANNDEALQNLPVKSAHISKIIIGAGVLYFGARLIGFDTIKSKLFKKKLEKVDNAEMPIND